MVDSQPPGDFNDPIWTILDLLPSMLSYWDCDLQCRFANRAYEKWFGVKASSLFDSSLRDLLGPELFARSEAYIQGVLRGEPQEFARMYKPGETGRAGLVNYLPHVVNGKVRGFVVQVTDVSLLYHVQEQLHVQITETERACALYERTDALLRQAQALGQIGSWEWDVKSGLAVWSDQLYTLYGLDPSRSAPTLPEHEALYTAQSWKKLTEAVARAIETGAGYTIELEYLHTAGVRGWLEARGMVRRNAEGAVVALHGTAQDISARRVADSAGNQAARIEALQRQLADVQARNAALEGALAQRSSHR